MSPMGLVSRVAPVHTAVRNCTRDEGRSFEVGNQVLISSHRKLLSSKAMVVNVAEKSEGEMAMVDGSPRSATVCAIKPSTVSPIDERRFINNGRSPSSPRYRVRLTNLRHYERSSQTGHCESSRSQRRTICSGEALVLGGGTQWIRRGFSRSANPYVARESGLGPVPYSMGSAETLLMGEIKPQPYSK